MPSQQGDPSGAEEGERGKIADLMQRRMGDSRLGTIGKPVSKPVMDHLQYPGLGIYGYGHLPGKIPQLVQPGYMVVVFVSEQYRIDVVNAASQHLLPKVGAAIN